MKVEPVEPMSSEVERDLVIKAQAGDRDAMNTLVVQWIPMIKTRVGHWFSRAVNGTSSDDLMSAGMMGMLEGIRRWEADKGYRLITYAKHWVDQCIRREMSKRLIHIPEYALGGPLDVTDRLMFFESAGVHWTGVRIESVDPAEQAIRNLDAAAARKAINRVSSRVLTRREAQVVRMYFIKEMTPRQIARELGISDTRVGHVVRKARKKLESSATLRRLVE